MSSSDEWTMRIRRAERLAEDVPAMAEVLRFYAAVVAVQRRLSVPVSAPAPRTDGTPPPGTAAGPWLDVEPGAVAAACPAVLEALVETAPPGVRAVLDRARPMTQAGWVEAAETYLGRLGEPGGTEDAAVVFVVETVVQAVAVAHGPLSAAGAAPSAGPRCPRCGAPPLVGVLREVGHGARRHLVCAVCLHEWTWLRATCAACGEPRADALAVFGAPDRTAARIEACQSCRTYLKTLDATRDPGVVPPVDDLASAALDVWARGQGYVRLRANLLRL